MVDKNEVLMYKMISALANMGAPIVFKGALVLKLIQMQTGNIDGLDRETHDIDGDWVGGTPDMMFLPAPAFIRKEQRCFTHPLLLLLS